MKTVALIALFVLCSACASAAPRATVVIHPTAQVSGDYFELSDIATVTSTDTVFRLQLMNAVMGRCPLAGLTRPFNEGDVTLKLRQAGVDPSTVAFSGASQLILTGGFAQQAPASGSAQPGAPTGASSTAPLPAGTILIHSGDNVNLVYDYDGMVISANVVATSSGAAGATISLRRDGAIHTLQGIVQDAQTVRMVE